MTVSPALSPLPDDLSGTARTVWAKYYPDEAWLPLWRHMADSAAVAGLLWDGWLPRQVRGVVAAALPGGAAEARRLGVWLAAVHDIGKATPAFACQVGGLADRMRAAGLEMPTRRQQGAERRLAPHGLAGQLLLRDWLAERHGWKGPATLRLAAIVGGHHGVPPTHTDIKTLADRPFLLRARGSEETWHAVQEELLTAATAATGADAHLVAWREVKLPQPAQVLLSALVIVSDWIASNRELFPCVPDASPIDPDRVAEAWAALALPHPWDEAAEPAESTAELFATRFALPGSAAPRPVQEETVRAARETATPGMLIVEAPMGEGKTEAALAATEILAARTGAGGCLIALPTMATGNAMFSRLLAWRRRLLELRGETGADSVFLAHSKAALNDDYARLPRGEPPREEGEPPEADIDRDGLPGEPASQAGGCAAAAELVAHHWLRGRKRGMLSSFVAGTIDQLLFAGLKSRHLVLRHLALAGKVVVVDEAHAYDVYMGSYLDRVLSWLGAYGVPVVVLSATLPARRRGELAAAYTGRRGDLTPLVEAADYPLVTAAGRDREPALYRPAASGRSTRVTVERLDDDPETLAGRLAHELGDGGCAAVVRNTVTRVQETAHHLRRAFAAAGLDIRVTVAHARYVDIDRVGNDARLLAAFGPPETATRPIGGHVVVASQVAEQSLDIDFDLMVTDLAPVDLLLQRMGRLHRHRRERPERLRAARCLITGVDWDTGPPEPIRGSRTIYRPYPLLRAAAVLESRLAAETPEERVIRLPEEISPLVQRAYGDEPVGPPRWREELERARAEHVTEQVRQERKAETFRLGAPDHGGKSLIGWVDAGVGDAEDTPSGRAQVRDSEDGLEVLVVRRRADGTLATLPHLGDGLGDVPIPEETPPPAWLGRAIAMCALRLPFPFTLPDLLDRVIEELEENHFPAWQAKECHWLAGELILVLDENCHTRLVGYELTYSRSDGLEVSHAR